MELKNGSLLSKFTSFLKEIGSTADAGDSGSDSEIGSHPNTAARERKHHDDAIRSREFTQLRALIEQKRKSAARTSRNVPRLSNSVSPSAFDALSQPASVLDQAQDDPQLDQWWGSATPAGAPTADVDLSPAPAPSVAPAPVSPSPAPVAAVAEDDFDLDFTALLSLDAEPSPAEPPPEDPVDQALRQAALRFAEGDFAGAEDHIMAALGVAHLDADALEMLNFALFDIYRATGQKDHFEAAALDYAQRNGRSPAEWYSLPALLADLDTTPAQAPSEAGLAAGPERPPIWNCPPELDSQALIGFAGSDIKPALPATIDWSALRHIHGTAAPVLAAWLRYGAKAPVTLHWSGTDALRRSLAAHTQQAPVREDALWWQMHMNLLCILKQDEDFETLALDYCVAFEVSPPAWENAPCILIDAHRAPLALTQAPRAPANTPPPSPSGAVTRDATHRALSGEVTGPQSAQLKALQTTPAGTPFVSVSCALLRRIDAQAMDALLAWVRSMQGQGTHISFTQVPRLVLVSMLMHGLDDYASLATRAN